MESKKRSRTEDMTESQIAKKQILEKVSSSSLLPTSALLEVNEDFRIVVGTYERLLYGINANWNEEVRSQAMESSLVKTNTYFHRKPKSSLNLYSLFPLTPVVFVQYPSVVTF